MDIVCLHLLPVTVLFKGATFGFYLPQHPTSRPCQFCSLGLSGFPLIPITATAQLRCERHLDYYNSLWLFFLPPDFLSVSSSLMLLPEGFTKTQVDCVTSRLRTVNAFHHPNRMKCKALSAALPLPSPQSSALGHPCSPPVLTSSLIPVSPVLSPSKIIRPPNRWRPLHNAPCTRKPDFCA